MRTQNLKMVVNRISDYNDFGPSDMATIALALEELSDGLFDCFDEDGIDVIARHHFLSAIRMLQAAVESMNIADLTHVRSISNFK